MKPQATRTSPAFRSHSRETGSEYHIYVERPRGLKEDLPLAAVLLMDGDFLFDPAVAAARALAGAGKIPPLLIVGVGYGASFGQPGNHRGRDYTPTASAEEPSSGGADAFLRYLSGALWPEIRTRYAVREDGRAIAGHSLGSLLVLHALFQEKPFFELALASAPSLWWDNRSILASIAGLRRRVSRIPGRLYLGVGSEDSPSMTGDLALLGEQLNAGPFEGLSVRSETLPGHDHYDVVSHTLASGLGFLFAGDPGRGISR